MKKPSKPARVLPRISQYRAMWLLVFFDLPTDTKRDKQRYRKFRESLQKDGFTMHQYSVYLRHCASQENATVHMKRVEKATPPKGMISVLTITDKQYSRIINIIGKQEAGMPPGGFQLEIF